MEGPGWCTSIPETKNYYTRPWASLTLNDGNCPHRGCPGRI
ncbi:protein-tyrosine-phosphatase [Klebsiella phage vB_KpnM-VAC25]|uniref:Protein-tyrosine-phosphatase n=1 Tax=Klebsiella phage vB_KpnM-VAC25 TaxID=2866703 RepID=A0A976M161_9CAUD|nr:protein-tyrosine-phosphatase [Klebsiella phage vB_KpnM-VAC25]